MEPLTFLYRWRPFDTGPHPTRNAVTVARVRAARSERDAGPAHGGARRLEARELVAVADLDRPIDDEPALPGALHLHGYVTPTLIDGLTIPHNPALEYDIFAKWNQARTARVNSTSVHVSATKPASCASTRIFQRSSRKATSLSVAIESRIPAVMSGVESWSSLGSSEGRAQALNPNPPSATVRLVFIHHSVGENLLNAGLFELGLIPAKDVSDARLNALIEEAVSANLDLQIVQQRICQARAMLGIVGAEQFPMVNVGGSFSRIESSQTTYEAVRHAREVNSK